MSDIKKLRIGTRGSPLALKQASMVQAALAHAAPDLETEIVVIKTSGDWKPEDGEVRLPDSEGGKALFAKQIEESLLQGVIDVGVHSMKDMNSTLPEGLQIHHILPRADVRDAVLVSDKISKEINSLADSSQKLSALPQGIIVGSCSVRREAFLRARRPDFSFTILRGNVQTRIDKLRAGQVDVTLLASAGLHRLGLESAIDFVLEPDEFLPAAGQGAIGIEMRTGEKDFEELFNKISCLDTVLCVTAERAALRALDGSCHTPIGAYATIEGAKMHLRLALAALDGSKIYEEAEIYQNVQTIEDADKFGEQSGQKLKAVLPGDLLWQKIA